MADTIHAADIVTQFGDYYINGGQNETRLYELLRQPSVTPSFCTPIITDDTEWRAAIGTLGNVIQAFQKTWTPKGELTFKPRKLKVFNPKIDLTLFPDELKNKWLGFLTNILEPDRAKWPLIRWMLEKHVIPQIHSDLETLEYYKGIFVEPTPGTPGITGQTMDGLRMQFRQGIIDGEVNPIGVGPITPATAFDQIEAVSDEIPDVFDSVPSIMGMSPRMVRDYLRDKRNTHGTDTNYTAGKANVEFRDNMDIVGFPSMSGTTDIFVTPKANLAYLRKSGGMTPLRVESAKREVHVMGDWNEGIGAIVNQLVWFRDGEDTSNSGT